MRFVSLIKFSPVKVAHRKVKGGLPLKQSMINRTNNEVVAAAATAVAGKLSHAKSNSSTRLTFHLVIIATKHSLNVNLGQSVAAYSKARLWKKQNRRELNLRNVWSECCQVWDVNCVCVCVLSISHYGTHYKHTSHCTHTVRWTQSDDPRRWSKWAIHLDEGCSNWIHGRGVAGTVENPRIQERNVDFDESCGNSKIKNLW